MMNFYELTYPKYISDQAERRNNPVKLLPNISVPSIICNDCGLWSSSERIRRKIDITSKAKEILNSGNLYVNDWYSAIKILSEELGIDAGLLKPGTELGMPRGEIANVELPDFIHPFPGLIWVNDKVKDFFSQQMITGAEFSPVETNYRKVKGMLSETKSKLWEMVVFGKAWRKGVSYENTLVCTKCNRTKFHDPSYLQIDESRWDGSDFITLDLNPNIIIVTERICEFLGEKGFTNYSCKKI